MSNYHSDTVWIDLCCRFRDVHLREHLRAYTPLQMLRRPEEQRPQIITFIGEKTKNLYMERCFSLQTRGRHRKIVLRTVPNQFASDAPLFIADCELHNALSPSALLTSEKNTSGIERHNLKWLQNIPRAMGSNTIAHLIYTQLLFPFSTVVCIFADDLEGTDNVAKILASWLRLRNSQLAFPPSTFARVMIFVSEEQGTFDEKLATTKFLKQLRQMIREERDLPGRLGDESLTGVEFEKLLKENAFELRLLSLPATSNKVNLEIFRTRLQCESEEIHNFRSVSKIAFTARHLQYFFQYACRHFADSIIAPLDFLQMSRIPNPVPTDLLSHLARFAACIPSEHQDIIATVIASALRLDSFPPRAHIFDPRLVFQTLYSSILENALVNIPNLKQVIQEIESSFCEDKDFNNTAWIHKQLLQCFSDIWMTTFSNSTCLSCLARAPNSILPCKHSFCDTCINIHGRTELDEPCNFHFESCPLCNAPMQVSIPLKPSTAGVRCLVADSGSYNDFEMLDTLEQEMKLPISIHEHFDIVNGSGIGAWVVLERFCNERSSDDDTNYQNIRRSLQGVAEEPMSRFSDSSTLTGYEVSFALKRIEGAFKALPRWSGSLQSSMRIISSLNAIFGDTTLLECRPGSTKLGLTVTRSKDSATCVLSNYNIDGKRPLTYKRIREGKVKNEVQLSQCARIALSPKSVHGYHAKERDLPNEVIDITLQEQDLIWKREGKAPDILIALGARIPPYDQPMIAEKVPTWIADFRLRNDAEQLERSADVLLATLFYLELIGVPQLDELGYMFCRIQVRCRISPTSRAYRILIARLREHRSRFYFDYQSVPCVSQQLHDEASRGIAFSRCIEMSVPTLQHSIDVKIDGITSTSQRISNCPYRVQQLIEDQGLNCVFGNKDHKSRYFGSMDSSARFI